MNLFEMVENFFRTLLNMPEPQPIRIKVESERERLERLYRERE